MRVDLHPEARAEFRSAALWYEERRNRLGEEFVAAVDAAFRRISEAAKLFPRWPGTEQAPAVIRKAPVEQFPYVIAFEEHEHYASCARRRPSEATSALLAHPSEPRARLTRRCSLRAARGRGLFRNDNRAPLAAERQGVKRTT